MRKKKEDLNDGQFFLDGFSTEKENIQPDYIKISEIYQKKEGEVEITQQNLPEEIKKNRSQLITEIVSSTQESLSNFEQEELSEFTTMPIKTRVQLLYEKSDEMSIDFKEELTSFDREVIDAVATLAPYMKNISASTIFRVITGKGPEYAVKAAQRKKIDESMIRCSRCLINIDITDEFLANNPSEVKNTQSFKFRGQLIAYESFIHKAKNGGNIYYSLYKMPPLFTYAEMLGKVSEFPLYLLDTPVSKTDNIISVQSYLLRSIDELKKNKTIKYFIPWLDIYKVAEIDTSIKQYTANIRTSVKKILEYWIEKEFIAGYVITTNKNGGIEFKFDN